MADKKRQAEKLYDSIGGIRDDYIANAESYTKNRFLYHQKLLSSLAACVVILILVSILSDVFLKNSTNEAPDEMITLQSVLENYESKPKDEVDLFSGEKLIWYSNGEYREKELTYVEFMKLTGYMNLGFEKTSEVNDEEYFVWICDGHGNVVSPYLQISDGNVYVNLFSYKAEVMPNEAFTKYVQKILT